MSLESFERRGMVLKLEATENTDSLPTPIANAFQIINGRSGLQADKLPRQLDRPFFGGDPSVPTKFRGFIEGEIEITGAAVAGAASPLSPVLQICGMAETLVVGPPAIARYNVISNAIPSASAYFYHAGELKKILGARGNLSGLMMEIGKYFMAKVRIEGNCNDVTEAALPTTLDYSAFASPAPYTTEFGELKINGFNVDGVSLSVDYGNELGVKEHTEARIARISDRQPTFTARFYRPAHASLNCRSLWRNATIIPIIGTNGIGAGAGKSAKLSLLAQIEDVQEVELEKDFGLEIKGSLVPSSAGHDEIAMEFGTLP